LKDTAIGAGTGLAVGGAAKVLPSVGSAVKTGLEDIATAPFGTNGSMGIVPKMLNGIGNAGKAVNNVTSAVTKGISGTDNEVANQVLDQVIKKGSYAIPYVGQAQAAVDTAAAIPAISQKFAQLGLKAADKLAPAAAPLLSAAKQGATSLGATAEHKQFSPERIIEKTKGTRYASVLENASQRGPEALRAANFVLQGQDPEYRKLTIGDDDRNEDQADIDYGSAD
jgi:hypothetical protein